MNGLTTGGMWTITGTISNKPDGTSGAGDTCLVIERGFNAGPRVTQLLSYGASDLKLWGRVGTGDPVSWSDWRPITPQTVSNANGEYTRHADGPQICLRTLSKDLNSVDNETFTHAAGFTEVYSTSVSLTDLSGPQSDREARFEAVNNMGKFANLTELKLRCTSNHLAAETVVLKATTYGRWY